MKWLNPLTDLTGYNKKECWMLMVQLIFLLIINGYVCFVIPDSTSRVLFSGNRLHRHIQASQIGPGLIPAAVFAKSYNENSPDEIPGPAIWEVENDTFLIPASQELYLIKTDDYSPHQISGTVGNTFKFEKFYKEYSPPAFETNEHRMDWLSNQPSVQEWIKLTACRIEAIDWIFIEGKKTNKEGLFLRYIEVTGQMHLISVGGF